MANNEDENREVKADQLDEAMEAEAQEEQEVEYVQPMAGVGFGRFGNVVGFGFMQKSVVQEEDVEEIEVSDEDSEEEQESYSPVRWMPGFM
jgi:hypothetical protein